MNVDGLCFCGCGEATRIATKNHTKSGTIKGQPQRFIKGHATRGERNYRWIPRPAQSEATIKLCECGCQQPSPIATRTARKTGAIKGQPQRYINGHSMRREENKVRLKSIQYRAGENHLNWKGGKQVRRGYVLTYVEGSPKNHRLEHVVIAERVLGRSLPEQAEVHHVNGKKADNRNQNLVICQDRAYHQLLHLRQRAYAATGNPNSRRCQYCRKWELGLTVDRRGKAFHRVCMNKNAVERYHKKKGAAS